MIFKHENYVIDLNDASKAKLYYNNQLLFVGDGYKVEIEAEAVLD